MHADHQNDTLETVRQQFAELERSLQEVKAELWPETFAQGQFVSFLVTEKKIRQLLKARRLREQQLGPELFADPAWDIILEAFAASLGQKQISVSDLCHTSTVPATTALRWINTLQRAGWLERRPDPADGRRQWIELTATAQARIQNFFQIVLPTILPLCTDGE